jgi:hypothetical protein
LTSSTLANVFADSKSLSDLLVCEAIRILSRRCHDTAICLCDVRPLRRRK